MSDAEAPAPQPAPNGGAGNGRPAAEGAAVAAEGLPADVAAEVAEVEDQLRRALADLDNMRKRYQREAAFERERERARVTAEWLPIVDNLERAVQFTGGDCDALLEGLRAVRDQAIGVLNRLGFPRFDDVGETFDPARHEAVSAVENEAPAGTVLDAARPGYGTGEAILRPAAVVVSKGSA